MYNNNGVYMYHNGYTLDTILFKEYSQTHQAQMKYYWASLRDFGTYHMGDQRRLWRVCASTKDR